MVGVVLPPLAVEAVKHVVGIEVAARLEIAGGVEFHALAQFEGIDEAVRRHAVRRGEARYDARRAALEFNETVVDVAR